MSPYFLLHVDNRSHADYSFFFATSAYEFHYSILDSDFGIELKRHVLELGTRAEDLEHVPHFLDEALFVQPRGVPDQSHPEDWKGYSSWGPVGVYVRGQSFSLALPWLHFSIVPLIDAYADDPRPEVFYVTFDEFWAGVDDYVYGEHFAGILDRPESPGAVPKRLGYPRSDDSDRPSATRNLIHTSIPISVGKGESSDDTVLELFLGALSIGIPGEPAMSGHAFRTTINELCPPKKKVKTRKSVVQVVEIERPQTPEPEVLEDWSEPLAEFLPEHYRLGKKTMKVSGSSTGS